MSYAAQAFSAGGSPGIGSQIECGNGLGSGRFAFGGESGSSGRPECLGAGLPCHGMLLLLLLGVLLALESLIEGNILDLS